IFNAIAQSYDRTNGILSFGFNAMWHRRMIREVGKVPHQKILDLACGTGTLTIKLARLQNAQTTALDRDSLQKAQTTALDRDSLQNSQTTARDRHSLENAQATARDRHSLQNAQTTALDRDSLQNSQTTARDSLQYAQTTALDRDRESLQNAQTTALDRDRESLQNAQITGVDPSANMLSVAKKRLGKKENVTFVKGYAESLPFSEGSFAVVTVSYGIRNFADMEASLLEIKRVLQPGGRLFILEFSPEKGDSPAHVIKRYYIHKILPRIGWLSTGQRQAYEYLRDSVESFPQAAVICSKMEDAGFTEVSHTRLKPGVAVLFTGVKLK
ncbi:MAG: methyltransferase domain-containing protein, partial [Verrucomicrobiae bacterium]|nr:methyltransferase domain-containing protein [Verrucomicrobiae bacterium]